MTCKRTRSIPFLVALCALGGLSGGASLASDLTIGPAPHALHRTGEARAGKTAAPARKPAAAKVTKAAKTRHAEKERQRRIVTYNLFHDPVFKLGGAITDRRHLGGDIHSLTRSGAAGMASTGTGLLSTTRIPSPTAAPLKLAPAEDEGFALDCQEKPFTAVPVRRRLTACFKQRLDNSWKTQTYVSGARADGSMSWGGGLSLGYDY